MRNQRLHLHSVRVGSQRRRVAGTGRLEAGGGLEAVVAELVIDAFGEGVMRGEVESEEGVILVRTECGDDAGDVVVLVGAGHVGEMVAAFGNVELEEVGVDSDGGEKRAVSEGVKQSRDGWVHTMVGLQIVLRVSERAN